MAPLAPLDCANMRCMGQCEHGTHFISPKPTTLIWMLLTRGWNGAWLSSCLICKSIGLSLDWWDSHHTLTCFQSEALIVGIGLSTCGALGGHCAYFLLLCDTWPWPRNTHYSHHPTSSCCKLTLGTHTNRPRRTNTQEARKHSWGLNSERPG